MRVVFVLPILFLSAGVCAQNNKEQDIKALQSYKDLVDEHLPSYEYNLELKGKLIKYTKDISTFLGNILDQYKKDGTYDKSAIDKIEESLSNLKRDSYEFAFKEAVAAYTVFQFLGPTRQAEEAMKDLKKLAS